MRVFGRFKAALLVATLLPGCGVLEGLKDKAGLSDEEDSESGPHVGAQMALPALNLTIERFESCAALQAEVKSQLEAKLKNQKAMQAYYAEQRARDRDPIEEPVPKSGWREGISEGGIPVEAVTDADQEADDKDVLTNVQEQGIDEADHTKVGPHHIFVVRQGQIEVVDRASLKVLGRVSVAGYDVLELYAAASKLVLIGSKRDTKTVCREVQGGAQGYVQKCSVENVEATHVLVYDAKPGALPKLEKDHAFVGTYLDSRVKGDRLFLVMNAQLPVKPDAVPIDIGVPVEKIPVDLPDQAGAEIDVEPNAPECVGCMALRRESIQGTAAEGKISSDPVILDESGKVAGLDCTEIAKPAVADLDFRLTKVHSVSLVDHAAAPHGTAVIGGGTHVYMGQDALYVTKAGLHWVPWVAPELYQDEEFAIELAKRSETLVVSKVALGADGKVAPAAAGKLEGRVIGQWAFKEFPAAKALAVMTTTRGRRRDNFRSQNHLWVMTHEGQTLTVAAAINDFGTDETIRSVRYVGNVAYAVTFREVDPLFAFDMTDPLRPALLGELKIPGFSTYMHPHGEDRLIGIGFDGGIQVSLFDVSNKTDLQRLDVKVLGQVGSQSEATYDHRAFYYDAESAIFALPIQLRSNRWWAYDVDKVKELDSGAIFYKIEANALVEIARVSHRDLAASACFGGAKDVSRIFKVDGRILTISDSGIKAHDPADLSKVKASIVFGEASENCSKIVPDREFLPN